MDGWKECLVGMNVVGAENRWRQQRSTKITCDNRAMYIKIYSYDDMTHI